MSKVALRVYNREIETLIDQNQIAEAAAHCQHILKTYPKHLETYRLLGKAYLEGRRLNDAADIFQRVLLALPDDFVSHLGMSLVRDEQKDLDGAIWHMERAFECRPSSAGVQSELRRLYGRRDGMEPPKIRLNRGALAQMYTKGGQFQQALTEIKAVLAEEPTRSDMKILQARAYFRAGMKVEATEVCTELLKQYPYNLDANRILVEILPGTSLAASVDTYRKRVNALDPYSALATTSIFDVESVPDNGISIERLEYDPGGFQSAAWEVPATPVNVEPAATATPADEIPDWMQQAGWAPSTGEFQEGSVDFEEAQPAQAAGPDLAAAEIPDWLKAMAPPGSSEPTTSSEQESFGQEDLDWLNGLAAPATETPAEAAAPLEFPAEEAQPVASEPDADQPDWLAGLGVAATGAAASDDLDWLGSVNAAQPEAPVAQPPAETSDDNLDWLAGMSASQPQAEELPSFTDDAPAASADNSLDWLNTLGAPLEAAPASEEMPKAEEPVADLGWLSELASAADEAPAAQQEAPQAGESTFDFSAEMSAPDLSSAQGVTFDASEAAAADLDWLAGLSAPMVASGAVADEESRLDLPAATENAQEPSFDAGEEAAADLDWLAGLSAPSLEVNSIPAEEPKLDLPAETTLPDAVTPQEISFEPAEESASDMDWLAGLSASVVEQEASTSEPLPDWLSDLPPAVPVQSEPVAEWLNDLSGAQDPADGQLSALISGPGTSEAEQDEALKWLESLAEKQGAKAEELITNPADRIESVPDWVNQVEEIPTQPAAQPSAPYIPEQPIEVEAEPVSELSPVVRGPGTSPLEQDEALKWLESLAEKQGAKAEELITAPEERLDAAPGWVGDVQNPPTELSALISGPGTSESEQDDAMRWLEMLAAKQGAKAEELITNPEERTDAIPDWVGRVGEEPDVVVEAAAELPTQPEPVAEAPVEEPPAKPRVTGDDDFVPGPLSAVVSGPGTSESEQDDAMRWLEMLAAKQGAKAEELITAPEERTEVIPDWVGRVGEEADVVAETPAEALPAEPVAEAPVEEPPAKPRVTGDDDFIPGPLSAVVSGPGTSESEQDDAMRWLEMLAAKQGAKAEELITAPEERTEVIPDWVGRVGEEPPQAEPEVTAQEEVSQAWAAPTEAPAPAMDESLDWLGDLAKPADEPPAALPWEQPASEALSFEAPLEGALPAAEGLPWEQPATESESLPETDDWLASLQQPQEVSSELMPWEQTAPEPEASEPVSFAAGESAPLAEEGWLAEEQPAEAEPVSSSQQVEDVSAWLKSLDQADESAPLAEAAQAIEPVAAETTADFPTWLDSVPTQAQATDSSDEELPDWLKDMSADEQPPAPQTVSDWIPAEAGASQPEPEAVAFEVPAAPASVEPPVAEVPAQVTAPQPVAPPAPKPQAPQRPILRQTGFLGDRDALALSTARQALSHSGLDAAMKEYTKLIKKGKLVEEVIYDLQEAVYQHPVDVIVWQTLGDAYMRTNRLQEALDAYTKAEELLR